MGDITCKFGGSSLADASCFRQVEKIIHANPQRRFIVPSAPGKRDTKDKKITDLLYAWHNMAKQGLDASEPATIIAERFSELARELGVHFDIEKHLAEIAAQVSMHATPDYMASRGEYLNGRLMAEVLNATFVDPADCIKFSKSGDLDPVTYELLGQCLNGSGLFVVPGFYGSLPSGEIKTFSRGGSDISGSIVARASTSALYENWTDVSGFRMADPRIVPEAKRIEEITYQELRELSYMGATVLHDEAIYPVREHKIPIHIRNTKDPDSPGTLIVADRESKTPVCGIAGRAGFSMITIAKALMNKERGFGFRVLEVLEEFGIAWEHMPTGIDDISLIIRDEEIGDLGDKMMNEITKRCDPDEISLSPGLAMIATVGKGMNHHVGVAARLCSALAGADINIRVIDQGSSEMNIIIGVEEQDLARAVRVIYYAFESWT
ncbi:MAG TPA: aspartate kinase [Candidatus Hydrogenedentes bacterium]|nr:aspartate kinase [Candidatus Hydrogenedentota bacterium]